MTQGRGPSLRVGIVGCGLIGRKRAEALAPDRLVGCYDLVPEAAEALAGAHGGRACGSLDELLALRPDVAVVATVHGSLAEAACAALAAGAHVLVEKPAGLGTADVERLSAAARQAGRLVKVGFNHRFHPGIARAVGEARSGTHGEVMFVRARYGHGGRLGYEQEWRCQPHVSGGGEVVDQGMHLLDLAYWLLGPLPLHSSLLRTQFWDAAVDDNALLVLGDRTRGPWAVLHASWTEWKNLFSLEIFCRHAKLDVEGLVRSYGAQELRVHRMRPELGPPDTERVAYPDRDTSFDDEWAHFRAAVAGGATSVGGAVELLGDLDSADYAWRCVEAAQAAAGLPPAGRVARPRPTEHAAAHWRPDA